jgi:hypothetical protein
MVWERTGLTYEEQIQQIKLLFPSTEQTIPCSSAWFIRRSKRGAVGPKIPAALSVSEIIFELKNYPLGDLKKLL